MKYVVNFLKGLGIAILSVFALSGFLELTVWLGSIIMSLIGLQISPAPELVVELPKFIVGFVTYIAVFMLGMIGLGLYKIGEKL